jgi:hypothetical protein
MLLHVTPPLEIMLDSGTDRDRGTIRRGLESLVDELADRVLMHCSQESPDALAGYPAASSASLCIVMASFAAD